MTGVLIETNVLEDFISSPQPMPRKRALHALTYLTARANQEVQYSILVPDDIMTFFFAFGKSKDVENTYLPSVGGISLEDISFLINNIWDDRKNFLNVQSLMDTAPGWTLTMWFFWLSNMWFL